MKIVFLIFFVSFNLSAKVTNKTNILSNAIVKIKDFNSKLLIISTKEEQTKRSEKNQEEIISLLEEIEKNSKTTEKLDQTL